MGLIGLLTGKQTVQFIQKNAGGKDVSVVEFDASLKEAHNMESPATDFPVEDGSSVSDHVILKPVTLEITGIISDSPIGTTRQLLTEVATTLTSALAPPLGLIGGAAGVALFSALAKSDSPSVAAYGQLLQLRSARRPVDVITSLYRYPNMWITNISAPRDASTGQALEFTISLKQLTIVSPQSVNIQVFSNPALSAGNSDVGQQGLGLVSRFKEGVEDSTKAIKQVVPGGLSGGTK